jgi:hypothetical protein
MKTRDTQGAFISLIWTLIAKVKQITTASSVPIHPHADRAADLLLQPVVSRSTQRRLAEDASLNHQVYRFSSVNNATSLCRLDRGALNLPVR